MEPDGFAERLFRLWQRDKDGVSQFETLVESEKQRKQRQPDYENPDLAYIRAGPPYGTQYLMDWYCELRGGEYLTYTEIRNWAELKNVELTPWEVDAIKQLDIIYNRISYEHFRASNRQSK